MGKYGRSRRGGGGIADWAPPNSIIYKDANGRWAALVPGVAGRFLQTLGPSTPPVWAAPAGGGSGGHTIQDETNPLTARNNLNFTGAGVTATDDSANDRTNIAVPGYSNFGASGTGHASGLVPDPGAVAGITKFLREDGSWIVPPTFGASGGSHAPGYVPDPGSSAGTVKFLREDATWQTPAGGGGGYDTIQDEGSDLTQRSKLNAVGAGVTASDDSGNSRTLLTIPGFYNTVKSAIATLTQRHALAIFGGSNVSISTNDNSGSDQSEFTIAVPTFVASGGSHAGGAVPDPGSTAGTTKFLREDATWQVPGGGGGGTNPSTLYPIRRGLLFFDDFGGYGTSDVNIGNNGPPEKGWFGISGTWNVNHTNQGQLQSTTGANDELLVNTSPGLYGLSYIVEIKARSTNAGSIYFGIFMGCLLTSTRQDNGFLVKNGDLQYNYHNGGGLTAATSTSTGISLSNNTYYRLKGQARCSGAGISNHYGEAWLDKVSKLTFNSSLGSNAPGWPGIGIYGGAPEIDLFCVYRDRTIRVYGLAGTNYAFRLYDSSNTLVGSSGTEVNGVATLDIMTLIDCPFAGHIILYTDNTYGTQVTDARWPAAGNDPTICGGDDFYYQA